MSVVSEAIQNREEAEILRNLPYYIILLFIFIYFFIIYYFHDMLKI